MKPWKHLVYIGVALCAVLHVSEVFAKRKYGMAGCGLGSVLFGDSGGQITAATTNDSFYSDGFGITTGTSNCTPDEAEVAQFEQEKFVTGNYATLSKEMAQGSGNTLVAYSEVLGCQADSFPQFARYIQTSYKKLIAAPGSVAMLDATRVELRQHPLLAQDCTHIN